MTMAFYWKVLENLEPKYALELSDRFVDIAHSILILLFTVALFTLLLMSLN